MALRPALIWLSGLAATGIAGAMVGQLLRQSEFDHFPFWGFCVGAAAFSCLRLWAIERSSP
jgi:hypothetical protein